MRPGNWLFVPVTIITCVAGIASTGGGVAAAPAPAIAAPPSDVLAAAVIGPGGGAVIVRADAPSLPGARVDVPAGAIPGATSITITSPVNATPPLFPSLPIIRVAIAGDATPIAISMPYSSAFLDEYGVHDPAVLSLYRRTDEDLWAWAPSRVDAARQIVSADVAGSGTWVIAPFWLLKAWQPPALVGGAFEPGARNVLVIHGWNASPWDACQLALMQGVSSRYEHVAAYAYPSALDMVESARWLRDEVTRRYSGVAFDIVGFSEGGLIARAAIEPGAWNGGSTIAANVGRLITIATPHTGLLPRLGPSILGDLAAGQMRPDSDFLRALNGGPATTTRPRYFAIAGAGDDGGTSDGLVGVESALGDGVINAAGTATLPLLHASTYGGAGMPCDERVYAQIARADWH